LFSAQKKPQQSITGRKPSFLFIHFHNLKKPKKIQKS